MTNEDLKKALQDIDVFKHNPEWAKAYALKLLVITTNEISRELKATRSILFKMNELLEDQYKTAEDDDGKETEETT